VALGHRINLFIPMVLVLLGDDRSGPNVHHDELSARERAVMFALLSAAGELSNADLQALIGIRLVGKQRRRLNELKLVESERRGRWFVHELSDAGLRWCAAELAAGHEGRPTSLERSVYLVLGMFERYLTAAHLSLADVASLDLRVRPIGKHKRRDAAEADGDPGTRVALPAVTSSMRLTPRPRDHACSLQWGGERPCYATTLRVS
jgi:DNA-binding transcriptional ArsR family regulator